MKTLVMTVAVASMFVGCESKTQSPVTTTTSVTVPTVEVTASPTVSAPTVQLTGGTDSQTVEQKKSDK